jgi:hypothetical protein
MLFPRLKPTIQLILVVQAICMLLGTYTHVAWTVRHGFLYPDVPIYSRLFWDSLTFLDPLAALLLFLRPRAGVILVATIILVDVLHNVFIGYLFDPYVLLQVLFGIFVWVTLRLNLRDIRRAVKLYLE